MLVSSWRQFWSGCLAGELFDAQSRSPRNIAGRLPEFHSD
jgi:hypothetical protein